MATVVSSIGLKGMEGYKVQVEVQLLPGVESVSIVGLPDASVKESKDRVMAALYANGCEVPDKKIVINLSPAEQRKNSPIFDLAMAIGIMKEVNYIKDPLPNHAGFLGVLSLDGTIKPVDGMLPAILAARKEKLKILYLPQINNFPLEYVEDIELRFVQTLSDVIESFSGQLSAFSAVFPPSRTKPPMKPSYDKDYKHILGHPQAKRALEVAGAGGHNVLMSGPPGYGKSLLAETFSSILPPLTQEAQYEVMSIYQLSGVSQPANNQLAPFRNPHHSSSAVSLIGGGSNPKPGEVSLAHRGVLFLDEMAEFPKKTLDMLRQPIETGKITISRAASTVTYPAQFILLGAMNPCPCGYLGSGHFSCTCTPKQITAYTNRVSGPIQDTMDIILFLQAVALDKESTEHNETSETIRARVTEARLRQYNRYGKGITNAIAAPELILKAAELKPEQQQMIQQGASKYHWSTRVQMKILRIARTISDLNGDQVVTNQALWEAMTLRRTQIWKQNNKRMSNYNG
ncbi:YifB family Mg chelatase-like AAA ATPase [Cytobacillus gottheilii]|uniref:YifB family Mg chelatase-like AAA ATPase n=1 Tax=Cytobacillus gottheilii TaxID=859144 RepID=UPI0009BC551C|nr:YifB family Mg chelatase-like AAA ATPase [Cytobacillus gottheilii]